MLLQFNCAPGRLLIISIYLMWYNTMVLTCCQKLVSNKIGLLHDTQEK